VALSLVWDPADVSGQQDPAVASPEVPAVRESGGREPQPQAQDRLSPPSAPLFVAPPFLFTDRPGAELLLWPEAVWTRDFGSWELDVRGSSASVTGETAWQYGLPVSRAGLSLTWRYRGILGGAIRPVFGVSAVTAQAVAPPHWSMRYDPALMAAVMPNAGLEMVYRGVGLGFRASLPVFGYARGSGFYHPSLGRRGRSGWGDLLGTMFQNMYFIWERDEPKR
jgi:hypothetical protein